MLQIYLFFAVEKIHSEEQMRKALDFISLFPVCNSYNHICYNETYILTSIYIYIYPYMREFNSVALGL